MKHPYIGKTVEIDGEPFTVTFEIVGNWKTNKSNEISTTGGEWFLLTNGTVSKDVHISVLDKLVN